MLAKEAVVASLDGVAVKTGRKDGEMFYYDGKEYTRVFEGKVEPAYASTVIGYADWRPNSPRPELLPEFH